jgi:hypothetical protein
MFPIKTYALVSVIALASAAGGYAMTSSTTGLAAGHVIKVNSFADAAAGHRHLVTTSINRTNKGDRLSVPTDSIPYPFEDLLLRRNLDASLWRLPTSILS